MFQDFYQKYTWGGGVQWTVIKKLKNRCTVRRPDIGGPVKCISSAENDKTFEYLRLPKSTRTVGTVFVPHHIEITYYAQWSSLRAYSIHVVYSQGFFEKSQI